MDNVMHTLTDEQLILLWYRGLDEEDETGAGAFDELHQRLGPILTRDARQHFGRLEDAEDVVQETWNAILRTGGRPSTRWDPARGAQVATWARNILRNKVYDVLRKFKGAPAEQVPVALGPSEDDDPGGGEVADGDALSPIDLLQRREDEWVIRACLEQLPEDQQMVLRLKYFELLKQTEIAEKMQKSEPWVSTKLNEARSRLLYCLKKMGYPTPTSAQ